MGKGVFGLLALFAIALAGSLLLEMPLQSHFILELYLLFLGVLLAILAIVAVAWDKKWGWPLACVLFSLLVLNGLVVYLNIHARLLTFEIVLVACIVGLLWGFLRATARDEHDPLETLPKMEFKSAKRWMASRRRSVKNATKSKKR